MLGVNELLSNAEKLGEATVRAIADSLEGLAGDVAERAASLAPVFSGQLRSDIRGYKVPGRLIARTQPFAPYAIAQEMGYKGIRGRGNRGHKLPMSPDLVEWAKAHGLNPFAVSRTIRRKGYPRQRFLFSAMLAEKEHILQELKGKITGAMSSFKPKPVLVAHGGKGGVPAFSTVVNLGRLHK